MYTPLSTGEKQYALGNPFNVLPRYIQVMDRDIKYLLITVGILVVIAGAHNYALSEEDAMDFGYCDTEIYCAGFNIGGSCLGVEQLYNQCIEPSKAEDYRRVEIECGVQAESMCNGDKYSGTGWAKEATYKGKTCKRWNQEDSRIKLLSCDQTFPPIQEWNDLK